MFVVTYILDKRSLKLPKNGKNNDAQEKSRSRNFRKNDAHAHSKCKNFIHFFELDTQSLYQGPKMHGLIMLAIYF